MYIDSCLDIRELKQLIGYKKSKMKASRDIVTTRTISREVVTPFQIYKIWWNKEYSTDSSIRPYTYNELVGIFNKWMTLHSKEKELLYPWDTTMDGINSSEFKRGSIPVVIQKGHFSFKKHSDNFTFTEKTKFRTEYESFEFKNSKAPVTVIVDFTFNGEKLKTQAIYLDCKDNKTASAILQYVLRNKSTCFGAASGGKGVDTDEFYSWRHLNTVLYRKGPVITLIQGRPEKG